MSNTILKFENVSKQYRLGLVGTGTLKHDVNRWWHLVRGKPDPYLKIGEENDRAVRGESEYVWALRDINLEVERGDVLGIIGKNGAGKSTLLKILSRVTSPTTGVIKSRGRIASLLEVGTGFHPELTGRENIFLNGAILGMTHAEISSKLDEIIEFSGCERYIETPVKRYSSGMRVRLAFAVAAHLEPEILVVDEVLAVGDEKFQKKAIGKMQDISKGNGRTVLFVSHNMAAVKSLCRRGILLENGRITLAGTSDDVVSQYLGGDNKISNFKRFSTKALKYEDFEIKSVGVRARGKDFSDPIIRDEEIEFVFEYHNGASSEDKYDFTLRLKGEDGGYVFSTSSASCIEDIIKSGTQLVKMTVPKEFFNSGNFYLDLLLVKNGNKFVINEKDCLSFTVNPEPKPLGSWMGKSHGYLKPSFEWTNGKI